MYFRKKERNFTEENPQLYFFIPGKQSNFRRIWLSRTLWLGVGHVIAKMRCENARNLSVIYAARIQLLRDFILDVTVSKIISNT